VNAAMTENCPIFNTEGSQVVVSPRFKSGLGRLAFIISYEGIC
jgi:hypothetical protein